jgi:hypothetical protein
MNLKQLINKSIYGTIGYISSQENINLLEQYILYNLPVLKEFKNIIVATNYNEDSYLLGLRYEEIWKKYFSNVVFIHSKINRGHNFGTADLDDAIFDYCKENNIEWLCKSANDMIFQESILDKEIDNADFYYTTSVGYGALFPPFEVTLGKIYDTFEYFYPQTNFYFINVFKTDYLNDKDHVTEIYNKTLLIPDYNSKAWEYGFRSCETLLKECIERNNLLKYHLVSKEKFSILLKWIKENHIHDPSHKNILIEGICHYQNFNKEVTVL